MSEMQENLYKLFFEIESHLFQDERPSVYLQKIYDDPRFRRYPFDMLHRLKNTGQSPKYHPEGNVWNHILLVVDEAARVRITVKTQRHLCGQLSFMISEKL